MSRESNSWDHNERSLLNCVAESWKSLSMERLNLLWSDSHGSSEETRGWLIIENYYDFEVNDSLELTTCQLLLSSLRFSMRIILMRIRINRFFCFLFCPTLIRFFISGNAVDFFWDVFNWVKSEGSAGAGGPGVFVFQVGEGGIWPEVIGAEGKLMKRCLSSSAAAGGIGSTPAAAFPAMSPAGSNSSVLQWAEESSSDGGRSSCSSSSRSGGINGGFSLLLYAWRKN